MTTTERPGSLRTGGQLVVDQLAAEGVDTVFGVPGESYLPVLDALYDTSIEYVACRHEGGAGYMADAFGRVTESTGVVLVTRGPGAANVMVAVHTAWQDASPLVVLVGLVPRRERERDAFQEFDLRGWFGSTTKAAYVIDQADRVPELLARAFATARSGRPGPVVVGLPEDMLRDAVPASAPATIEVADPAPAESTMRRLHHQLSAARRPLVVVGGGGWTRPAVVEVRAWAERYELPVVADFGSVDVVDHESPSYVGTLSFGGPQHLAEALRQCDLVLGVGSPIGDVVTDGWSLLAIDARRTSVVTVVPEASASGSAHLNALRIVASVDAFAAALDGYVPDRPNPWSERTRELRGAYEDWVAPKGSGDALDLFEVFRVLRERLTEDAIITWGAGNHGGWPIRHLNWRSFPTCLTPRNGSMGFGVPAAVAGAIAHPERQVVSFAGDGCFLMNGQELATATAQGVSPLIIVLNNAMYGTIRRHQEWHYPGRVSGTDLVNPDFAMYARSFGGHGETVEATEEFPPALDRALRSNVAAVIELRMPGNMLDSSEPTEPGLGGRP